ncbi:MAG: aldehyde dehydrogenase family protein [Hyphomicrobiales bacterium]|nr:MAG: aldehyde dehydrogenase family protein [Hyphomicrobiales bacterium]
MGATENFLRYAAENARRIEGDIVPSDARNEEVWIRRVPHGVVVGLTAWNYLSALAARKLGPALVAGNTFVLKAHEFTPMSGLALAALAEQVGFPAGVFNVVTGIGRTVGEALVASPLSDLVTMTGSTRAGKEIYRAGADLIKVIRLELGGKAPFIVMEDADIDAAVESAVTARFTNCGQICTCNERMYLHERIADEFLDKFVASTRALSIGDPLTNPDIGPKISGPEVEKVAAIVDETIASGAEVLLPGGPLREGVYAKGHWYAPTVLKLRDNTAPAMRQEIFGPVVPAMSVGSFEEALSLANDSVYGLSAYVYTRDMRRVMRLAEGLEFGEIYCNRTNGELIQGFHTGWKQSGLGGEDGKYGFDGYLRKKTMYVNWA